MMSDTLQTIKSVLSTTAAHWISLAENVPADLLARVPAPHEWSAVECLSHLLDTEQFVFPARVQAFLVGQDIPAFDPDTRGTKDASRTPGQLAADFARHRAANLAALERVTARDLERTSRHSELGIVTLGELLHEWVAHDLNHTMQAERAIMQPFIVASGLWRPYFKDHDVSGK